MSVANFCETCGLRLLPLSVPHVKRPCDTCERTTYVVEPGDAGAGIQIRPGDEFTIPAGWLKVSLDPSKANGKLFRPGVSWLVHKLLMGGLPASDGDVRRYLEEQKEAAAAVLDRSEKLAHLDLDDETDGQVAYELLEKDRLSIEWSAVVVGAAASWLLDELHDERTRQAVRHSLALQAAHSMVVFKRELEEHVWTGYKHTNLVYGIASAAARNPADEEKVRSLRPLFERLDEDLLHSWVNSEIDIGPRIGVSGIEEPMLRALAEYHLSLFERRRKERELETSTRQANRSAVIAAAGVGATVGAAVLGAVVALL